MILFSFPVIIYAALGALFGAVAMKFTGNACIAWIVGGLFFAGFDAYSRTGSNSNAPAIDPALGGHLWFIPGWVLGLVVCLIAIAGQLGFDI